MGPLVLSSPPPPVVCTLFIWLVAGVVLRENTGAWFVLRGKVLLVANKPSEHEGVGGGTMVVDTCYNGDEKIFFL